MTKMRHDRPGPPRPGSSTVDHPRGIERPFNFVPPAERERRAADRKRAADEAHKRYEDRQRAADIRQRVLNGAFVFKMELRWLEDYERALP